MVGVICGIVKRAKREDLIYIERDFCVGGISVMG